MGKLSYQTLRENVVGEIRTKIINRELEPGTRIIEKELSEELGVSRGPIREALRQLEQEGIVEYTRNVGCSVKKITIKELYEIYLLRSMYEILAVRLCAGRFEEKDIVRMEEILVKMDDPEIGYVETVSYDHAFHRIIVEKAESERITKVWADLDYGNMVGCYLGNFDKQRMARRQYPIHRELTDVCKSGDADVICKAISQHYMNSVERYMAEEGIGKEQFHFWGF